MHLELSCNQPYGATAMPGMVKSLKMVKCLKIT